jgi:ribosome-associated protein
MMIFVNDRLVIPDHELQFTFSRSSGPGGQNVNKVNSRATLRWNVRSSPSLPDDLRERFIGRFASRLTQNGDLLVSSQKYRDQPRNVEDCCRRVAAMLREVLVPPKRRRATRPTRGSQVRRLKTKRERSAKKESRRHHQGDE